MLARQIEVVAMAQEIGHHLLQHRAAVEQLLGIQAGHGTSCNVAHRIAAAAHRRQADALEGREHLGQLLDLDPMQLDVLAGRELGIIAAEPLRKLADGAVLGRRQDAAGDLDAQHEVAHLGLVVVQAVPLKADHILFGDVQVVALGQLRDLVDDVQRELLRLEALDVVALEHQVSVRRCPRSRHSIRCRPRSCRPGRCCLRLGASALFSQAPARLTHALPSFERTCPCKVRPTQDALVLRGPPDVRSALDATPWQFALSLSELSHRTRPL